MPGRDLPSGEIMAAANSEAVPTTLAARREESYKSQAGEGGGEGGAGAEGGLLACC